MPPWLVYNAQRSPMYPEIYMSMEFKRGSQNRNHYNKKKEDDDYVTKAEKNRLRKKVSKQAKKKRTLEMTEKSPDSDLQSMFFSI